MLVIIKSWGTWADYLAYAASKLTTNMVKDMRNDVYVLNYKSILIMSMNKFGVSSLVTVLPVMPVLMQFAEQTLKLGVIIP